MKSTITLLFFFVVGCSFEKSNYEKTKEIYLKIYQSPVLELCYGISVLPRGDRDYVFLHTNTVSIEKESGDVIWSHHKLLPIEEVRAKALVDFMKKNKIQKIDGNYSKSRELEFRINEKLVLIKNPSQEYQKNSKNSRFHTQLQKIATDWYFYEEETTNVAGPPTSPPVHKQGI
jgi:hypothetical protein